jgi:hypothetical protein
MSKPPIYRQPAGAPAITMLSPDPRAAARQLEGELARRPVTGSVAVFAAVQLRAPGGTTWQVEVDDAGQLQTRQVVPS